MNIVTLIGRLTKDPEVRYTQGAEPIAVARFTLAVDRRFKKENEPTADFISCVAFRKTAKFIETYLHQGSKIAVMGEIRTGNYTNRDGIKIYTTDVIINQCEFAESKGSGAPPQGTPSHTSKPDSDGFMNIPDNLDEELPFS